MSNWIGMMALFASLTAVLPAGSADAGEGVIKGTAGFRERIAMPPGALFEATLLDISRMDVPADVISTFQKEDAGNPPYAFELAYDPAQIIPSRTYAVRARVTLAGRLLFTSDQVHPVITRGSPTTVDIVMKRVAGAAGRATGGKPGDLFATLPASFLGVLPCADCQGIEHHLDVMPDRSYVLRTRYLGKPDVPVDDDIGSWAVSSDGITLALKGGREAPMFFSIEDADTLRKMDLAGRPIESELNYNLGRAPAFRPLEPHLGMQGMFSYMADAALFTECTTGRSLPVAMEGAYIDLERAYLAARGEPGQPLMTLVEGSIAMRPPMEGPAPVATLLVDRFLRLAPGEQCAPRFHTAALQGTHWKLVALGDDAVYPPEGQPEPHLMLLADTARASGSDGCNRFMAGYTLEGDQIEFTQAGSTMMACPAGDETARRFNAVITASARWRVLGQQLELYDAGGALLARFDARAMP